MRVRREREGVSRGVAEIAVGPLVSNFTRLTGFQSQLLYTCAYIFFQSQICSPEIMQLPKIILLIIS